MNERKLSALTACAMCALSIVACFAYVLLGYASDCQTQQFVLELPIFIQLLAAEAIGLQPLLAWLYERTHWTVLYALNISTSFCALYWIVGGLGESTRRHWRTTCLSRPRMHGRLPTKRARKRLPGFSKERKLRHFSSICATSAAEYD